MLTIYGPSPNEVTLEHIHDFLNVRKTEFVDRLGWDLPHTQTMEWDQYDLPDALFAIAYEDGKCVGGARIIQTTVERTNFFSIPRSWMLADFVSNGGGEISADDLIAELPFDPLVWEMTRFVGQSPRVTAGILNRINDFLAQIGATHVVTISPALMPRVLRRLGYKTTPLSKTLRFDGGSYVVLETTVRQPLAKVAEYT